VHFAFAEVWDFFHRGRGLKGVSRCCGRSNVDRTVQDEEATVAWQTNLLVVANRTAGSDELIEALRRRGGSVTCTLLMPAGPGGREEARGRLDEALARMAAAGIEADGRIGVDPNPLFCIGEIWDPGQYDEILISTFPSGVSHWMNLDLPQRVRKLTDAPVEHVVSEPARTRVA
jgi:hypothetical protein